MFPTDVLIAYIAACVVVVLSPGPDNLLAIGRGLSQGRMAACLSAMGAGLGIMFHVVAATFGLALLIQSSPGAFWGVKAIGATYLLWLGYKALAAGDLVTFEPAAHMPLRRVLAVGVLSNVLNPKPGLFVLAFLPQFVDESRGSVAMQMGVYGAVFAFLTTVLFSIFGCFASGLAGWLRPRPNIVRGINRGAGAAFVAAGVSVLLLEQRGGR